jgi:predicted O-methyltransferase YrrM
MATPFAAKQKIDSNIVFEGFFTEDVVRLPGIASRASRDVVRNLIIPVHGDASVRPGPPGVFHAIPCGRVVEIGTHAPQDVDQSEEGALADLLSKAENLSRDEPEVAASIGAQLEHMELESMPISLRRRIRDVVARIKPARICEVGSGIGHLSAWLFDHWEANGAPEHHEMIEAGGKFGVILSRLIDRYDAHGYARVRIGDLDMLDAAQTTFELAHATTDEAARQETPLHAPYDIIIVDVGTLGQVDAIRTSLGLLKPGGLLLTPEPEVPIEDVGDLPALGPQNPAQARVAAFNDWVALIQSLQATHPVGFVPLYGGTLVGMIQP